MAKALFIALAVSMLLLFGCTINVPLPWENQNPVQQNVTPAKPLPQDDVPPAPPSDAKAGGDAPPPPPDENMSASQPSPPPSGSAGASPASSDPAHYAAVLDFGKSLDFGEGSFTLDDVWVYSPAQPALYTVRDSYGKAVKSGQIISPNEVSFTMPSGKKYWAYARDIAAPLNISVKRAKIYIIEAGAGDTSFDASKYAWLIGNDTQDVFDRSLVFGTQIKYAFFRTGQTADAGNVKVRLDSMNRYPEGEYPAIFTILGQNNEELDAVTLPSGSAYVFSAGGRKYAIYNDKSAHCTQNSTDYVNLFMYDAAPAAEAGRHYVISRPKQEKKGTLIGEGDLYMNQSLRTERDFSVRLSDRCQSKGKWISYVELLDNYGYLSWAGFASSDEPLAYTGAYGLTYRIWQKDMARDGEPVSFLVYRTG